MSVVPARLNNASAARLPCAAETSKVVADAESALPTQNRAGKRYRFPALPQNLQRHRHYLRCYAPRASRIGGAYSSTLQLVRIRPTRAVMRNARLAPSSPLSQRRSANLPIARLPPQSCVELRNATHPIKCASFLRRGTFDKKWLRYIPQPSLELPRPKAGQTLLGALRDPKPPDNGSLE